MNVQTYLNRIHYDGPQTPTIDTLRALHLAHLIHVPFENLSIHADEPIHLTDEALFDKIVNRRRGGFCYELNGLFAALLQALGFTVRKLAAGVAREDVGFSPLFDHMTLLVTLEERWLVDVGFGDSFRYPLQLDSRRPQREDGRAYQITLDGDTYLLQEQRGLEAFKPQYQFTLQAYQFADYKSRCYFHQTSPESHFRKQRICSRATPDGRLTLSESALIRTTFDGGRTEQTVADEQEHAALLESRFGIVLMDPAGG